MMSNIHSCSDVCEVPECVEARRKRRVPRLDNFIIHNFGTCAVAEGNVYGDPRFHDGQLIHTSYIKMLSYSEGKLTTKNSFFYLGTPAVAPMAEEDVILKK